MSTKRRIHLFISFPLLLAAGLYFALVYPTSLAVQDVLKLSKDNPTLSKAFTKIEQIALPTISCDRNPSETSAKALCDAVSAAKKLAGEGRSEIDRSAVTAKFQSGFTLISVLVFAQATAALLALAGLLAYLRPRAAGSPFAEFRKRSVVYVFLASVFILVVGAWELPLTVEAIKLYQGGTAKWAPASLISTLIALAFTLFCAVLGLTATAAALLAATFDPNEASDHGIDSDILQASPERRATIIRGLFGLAVVCFVLTVAIVSRTSRIGQVFFDSEAAGHKLFETMASSVTIYWGVGLSALLAAIFLPPLAFLIPHVKSAEQAKLKPPTDPKALTSTGYGFLDILGDDVTKKIAALLALAAPALFPLLEKALG